jgi:hypothetical protein
MTGESEISLPPEILIQIVEQLAELGPRTLAPVLLSCRTLHAIVEPIFYRTLDASVLWPSYKAQNQLPDYHQFPAINTSGDAQKYTALLQTLANCPKLAQYVHSFTDYSELSADTTPWELYRAALMNMRNLKCLVLSFPVKKEASELLCKCAFQLDSFVWLGYRAEAEIIPFLQHQPDLSHLGVYWESRSGVDAKGLVPNLKSVLGLDGTMKAFLPGRAIHTMQWLPDRTPMTTMDSDPDLLQHLAQINRLKVWNSLRQNRLQFLHFFKNLRFLELIGLFVRYPIAIPAERCC